MKQIISNDGQKYLNNDFFLSNVEMQTLYLDDKFESFSGIIGYHCRRLENIVVSTDNPLYTSVDGILYTKNLKTLLRYPSGREGRSVLIAPSVSFLFDNAFSHVSKMQTLYTGPNLTCVGYDAFNGCSRLVALSIGRSVVSIPMSATTSCWSLKSIAVEAENTDYASYDGCLYTKNLKLLLRVPIAHDSVVRLPSKDVAFSKNCEQQWKTKVKYITEE